MMRPDSLQDVEPYFRGLREEMLPYVPDGVARALDVGCGAGGFGAMVRERTGAEVWGIEVNEKMAEEARNRLEKVLVGDAVEQLQKMPERQFDAIFFNDVLEHLVWPDQALRSSLPLLTERGAVIASIPNIRYFRALKQILWKRDFPWDDEGVFDRTHLRFFTKKSIVRLFEKSGYTVERIQGINPAKGAKLSIALFLTLGVFSDARYLQFAVVARPIRRSQASTCFRADPNVNSPSL